MSSDQSAPTRGRILGLGGVFFKSRDHEAVRTWYTEKLGLGQGKDGHTFQWRPSDGASEQVTAWSIFPHVSKYFDPSEEPFMINYIVDDLDALLERLSAEGVRIDPKREDAPYGRFAWIFDPEGRKIELWEPAPGNS
jgi:catechol 2,3-dioxygenase-like lactoylglutathione lyase family enzyme